ARRRTSKRLSRRRKTDCLPTFLTLTRRTHGSGINQSHNRMAWRPYENLIDGELDNRSPGKVTGWLRFYRNGKTPLPVALDLAGDFHEDIRGTVIRLSNPNPSDRNTDAGTYMEGFGPMQRGTAGDITAGLSLGTWSDELARRLMAKNELFWHEN